ncbi:MAG TPA: hypothetical protein VHO71_01540 [Caproiciproducens sp.]|nr:hypothetical protein [Caproiciproducens sp.]
MEERTPCPYCENFEGSGFEVQNGNLEVFNFCPVCGRPYTPRGAELLDLRVKPEDYTED